MKTQGGLDLSVNGIETRAQWGGWKQLGLCRPTVWTPVQMDPSTICDPEKISLSTPHFPLL